MHVKNINAQLHIGKFTKFCEAGVSVFPWTVIIWQLIGNIQLIKNCFVAIPSLHTLYMVLWHSHEFISHHSRQPLDVFSDALINALTHVLKKLMHALMPLKKLMLQQHTIFN